MRNLMSLALFVFLLGCSSKPSEKEITKSIHDYYNIDPCPSAILKYTLSNTIPGTDNNRLTLNIESVISTGKKHSDEEVKIQNTIWDKERLKKRLKIIEDEHNKEIKKYAGCTSCVESTIMQTKADIVRYSDDLFAQEAEGVAELYLTGCSKKTKDYFKIKILEQLKNKKSYNGELLKESIKVKIVKSNNGWVIDK